MPFRVNPKLIGELEKYGAEDVQKCYHCGNCSAICSIHDEAHLFPRKPMRLLQMGLEKRILASLDPWLCYYCGECSSHCPRSAEPGETMMSLRRWLTAQYDFTGISAAFYRSWKIEAVALFLVAGLTLAGLLGYGFSQGDLRIYDGPGAFLPSNAIHLFDWSMAAVLAGLLGINALRMWWFTTGSRRELQPRFRHYLQGLYLLPLHFFTQKRYGQCAEKGPWLVHLGLMVSYSGMLVLIMFFLRAMQSGPEIRWAVHLPAYAATAGLLVTVIQALDGRLRKTRAQFQHSHESDWIFLILLLLVIVSGVVQHLLHRLGSPLYANVSYLIHLSLVVPMLVLEVPFSKWSHMVYRPLAVFLDQVRRRADAEKAAAPADQVRFAA